MPDTKDKLTYIFSRAIDLLFFSNPQRTSLGVLLGVIVKGGIEIFCQVYEQIYKQQIVLNISYPFCIGCGIFLLFIPHLFSKHRIDEDLETLLQYLRKAQKYGNFTEAEKRTQWRDFVQLVFEKIGETRNFKKLEDEEAEKLEK